MKIKQNFLRKEIIERGYDPQNFAEYLSKHKKDGINIENWLITELEEMILKYKSEPVIYFKKNLLQHSEDLEISSDNSKDFKLKTSYSGNEIVRSLFDFEWTLSQISKEIPFIFFIKEIPKNYFLDFNSKLNEEKLHLLKHFLKYLYIYNDITNSELIRNFFTFDKESFDLYKKKYKLIPNPKISILNNFYFNTFVNIIKKKQAKEFVIETETSSKESVKSYIILLKNYLKTSGNLTEKFSKLINQLSYNFRETSNTLSKLTETAIELTNQIEILNTKLYTKFDNLRDTFSYLKTFLKNWRKLKKKILPKKPTI